MIKRVFVISLCFVSLIVAFAFPAFAAMDYNDYMVNIEVDGDNDIVSASIPGSSTFWSVYHNSNNYGYFSGSNLSGVTVPSLPTTEIYCCPFRDAGGLDVSNIPNGSRISGQYTLDFKFNPNASVDDFYCELNSHVIFLDASGNAISFSSIEERHVIEYTTTPVGVTFDGDFAFVMEKPNGAVSAYVELKFVVSRGYSGAVTVSGNVSSVDLEMSISSLYRQQQLTGKTNELLEEVENQLAANGDKLDEIINGTVDTSKPSGSGSVDDLDDAEAGLRDDSQAGLDQGLAMQQSALSVFLQYSTAFLCAGNIFGVFANIPFFSNLLYISVAVGLFALLLNLGLDGISALDRKQKKAQKANAGKKGK